MFYHGDGSGQCVVIDFLLPSPNEHKNQEKQNSMKKTIVVHEQVDEQVPFFRGILVKSLVNIEIPFDDAYELANKLRDELRDVPKISSDELGKRVAEMIKKEYGKEKRDLYELMHRRNARIIVRGNGPGDCFSLGELRHSLKACAIPNDTAAAGAVKVQEFLRAGGHKEVNRDALRSIVYRCLREHFSRLASDRYLSWRHFKDSGTPLILLIGGSTGSGKSTVAAELAYRLDIARLQSTDMMREVIRSYITPEVAPTLRYSSFEAWCGLPVPLHEQHTPKETRIIEGFLSQVATMRPALKAAIERAVQEGEHLILEGVHVLPSELDLEEIKKRAVVITLMLSTINRKTLRKRLRRRGSEGGERNPTRYLDHLDEIWDLQSFLVQEAEAANVNVLPTVTIETAIEEILDTTAKEVMKRFPPHPKRLNDRDWQ